MSVKAREVQVGDFLRSVRQKAGAKKEEDFQAYQGLLGRICDGEEITPDEVVEVLEAVGKSPDDLDEAVANLQKRRQWFATLTVGESAVVEIPTVEAEKTQFTQELNEVIAKARQKIGPKIAQAEQRLEELRRLVTAGQAASHALRTVGIWPNLTARQTELAARWKPIAKAIEACEQQLRRHRDNLSKYTARVAQLSPSESCLDQGPMTDKAIGLRAQLADARGGVRDSERGIAEMTARLAGLQEEAAGLDRESEELTAALLQP